MMIGRVVLWLGAFLVCGFADAQEKQVLVSRDLPLRTEGNLQVFVETASFRGPNGLSRFEVYSLLDARQLQFVPEAQKYVSQIDFTAALYDTAGQEVKRQFWTRNVSVDDIQSVKKTGALVRDMVAFDLPPGRYKLRFVVEDIYGDLTGQCEDAFDVRAFDTGALVVSDLLFSSTLETATETGRFVKNGWEVIPNTTRFFRVGQAINLYYEVYNFKTQPDNSNDSFVLGYSLVDTGGVVVKKYPAKRLRKPGESVVKTESLDTDALLGGVYFLQVELFDRTTREHVRHRRRLFLIS
ncbi:MAG: hypothetical protein ACO36I_20205, partial [Candidatus Latescibacterota bacterium]